MNSYLDKMNEEFFRPRNLYCVVMTWNPASQSYFQEINLHTAIFVDANTATPSSGMEKVSHKLRTSSGNTFGDFEFPETAPLVFPALDEASTTDGEKEGKVKRGKKFVDEYMDRRAQAKWAGQNPDSKLANTVKASFSSRYADPNNPVSSGNLFSLVTGGRFNPPSLGDMRGGGFRGRGGQRGAVGGLGGLAGLGRGLGGTARGFGGGIGGGANMNPLEQRLAMSAGGPRGRMRAEYGSQYYDPYYEQQLYEQELYEQHYNGQGMSYGRGRNIQYGRCRGMGPGGPGIGSGRGGFSSRDLGASSGGLGGMGPGSTGMARVGGSGSGSEPTDMGMGNVGPLGIGLLLGGAKNLLKKASSS
jgi:hypothetical protein